MAVVFKGNKIAVVVNNTRSSNNRSAKITTDIFDNGLRITTYRTLLAVTKRIEIEKGADHFQMERDTLERDIIS